MATLERIRNKAGIFITIFIGVALFAFVLTDLLQPGRSLFGQKANEIGNVNGSSIMVEEFQNHYDALEEWTRLQYQRSSLDENTTNRLHEQAWDQLLRQNILGHEYELLGIKVTDQEMVSQIGGVTPHPAIQQMFTNPDNGMFDRQMALESYQRRRENPTAEFFWNYMIEQIKIERLYNKYSSLLKNGMYVTSMQADKEIEAKKNNVTFDYLVKRYSTISDSSISVSSDEIKAFYKKHKENFKQEATRDIQYITFDIVPSEADTKAVEDIVTKAKTTFSDPATDVAQYINRNSDNAPYAAKNLKADEIAQNLRLFATTAQPNEVFGPYFEGSAYKLTRLVAIKQVPDSVKARHILVSANTPNADKTADSLFTLAKKGSDFAELARKNSQDPGSAVNGGDLGWFREGMMVKPFNDACFNNDKGDIVKVQSQFGWHIIQVQDKGKPVTKYELATYEKAVVYSPRTYSDIFTKANLFVSGNDTQEKFEKAVKDQNLTPRFGRDIRANDRRVGALESPRSLVKWAFEAEKGDISPIFELGNQIVIAVLTGQKEEGYASVNDVQNQIKAELVKEKKAEKLIAELKSASQGGQSLNQIAQKVGAEVQAASGINFNSYQVPGAGFEPTLVALAAFSPANTISQPIKGENGVYLVYVTGVSTQDNGSDVDAEKAQLAQANQYKVDYKAFEALRAKSKIKDNRIKFY
ncbi:MAG: peptidylprolyl isomerase [Breznakibacter sp.]